MTIETWIDFSYSKPPIGKRIRIKISKTCIFFAVYNGYGMLDCAENGKPLLLHVVDDFDPEARKNMQWSEVRV